jgi:hypothetical protein
MSKVGLGSSANESSATRRLKIKSGNFLFMPSAPLAVETAHGVISIAAGAVVLITLNGVGLGIFDFDDQRAGSVVYSRAANHTSLSPGGHLLISTAQHATFEELNSVQLLGYRDIRENSIGELHMFSADFDLLQAMSMLTQLRSVAASRTAGARKLTTHMVKTASILFGLGAVRGAYRPSPHTTLVSDAFAR